MDRSDTMWHLPETLREFEQTGDETIVLELIDSFQNDTAHRFERLHDAVARLDAATVKAEAHAVGGSARQMGAEALADLCQAVEAGAPQMTWPELENHLEQADLRFAEVRTAMSEFVDARWRASACGSCSDPLRKLAIGLESYRKSPHRG
jgi:HPt (histidine-containing phosphotransfer) domain-containing protein